MPAISSRRTAPSSTPAPSTGRRVTTVAVAVALTLGVTIGLDPFHLRAVASDPLIVAGVIAAETALGVLLLAPLVAALLDVLDAWVASEPSDDGRRSRWDGDAGGSWFGDGDCGGDGGGD